MTGKTLLLLTLFLSAVIPRISAQVCSTGSAQLFQDDVAVGGPCTVSLLVGDLVNVTEMQGYKLSCTTTKGNSNPGAVFFSDSVALTGHGQRYCGTVIDPPIFCDPRFTMTVTQATSTNDFHRFTFIEHDRVPTASQCQETAMQQIFRQCAGQPCDAQTAGGGVGILDPCLGGQGSDGGTSGFISAPDPTCSPIIIDTKGEGFPLTSAQDGVKFDITGTGHPIQLAWTQRRSHNAFLSLPGSDGLVHNGKELFGNFTPQPQSAHPNGFLALAEFDRPENGGNGDGIIDQRDAIFSRLRLWVDENHDGICQPGELHNLPELGVFSLALKYRESRRTDDFGNQFRYKARVNPDPADGDSETGRWTYDVFLTTMTK